jgi:mycoredoxin-dependent peroxiredoxin
VVGVSVDSVWANKAFADNLGLAFPVLSDARHDVSRSYGVYDEGNGVARRTTFVIDANGVVQHIDQSSEALDPNGAIGACPVPKKK